MPSGKGVTEVLVKLADGSVVNITADPSAGLQAIYFDVAAALAAGIPMGSGPVAGISVTTKQAAQVGGSGTMTAMATTEGTICYIVDGRLVCTPV